MKLRSKDFPIPQQLSSEDLQSIKTDGELSENQEIKIRKELNKRAMEKARMDQKLETILLYFYGPGSFFIILTGLGTGQPLITVIGMVSCCTWYFVPTRNEINHYLSKKWQKFKRRQKV